MLKILSVIGIVAICSYMGFALSKYYINRKKFFVELNLFLNSMNLDISFNQEKLEILLEKNIQSINLKELKTLINNYLSCLKQKQSVEGEKLFDGITLLKKGEKEYLLNFFKGLGRFDCENQAKEFEKYFKVIESSIEETSKEAYKYSSLYIKLGIIFGLFLSLILL